MSGRMRGIGRAAAGVALAASLAAGASPAWAQSITSVRGLGYPLLPVDARSAALGASTPHSQFGAGGPMRSTTTLTTGPWPSVKSRPS